MPQDQRILDIIAAASTQKPASVGPLVNELVGERVTTMIDQRREDARANFFAEPQADAAEDETTSTEDQPAETEEAPNGEDA